jgi:hypothetical protein
LGGTTGQILSKTSNTDLDFTWIEQDDTTLSFNAQTGTTYTLVASDIAKLVTTSNAAAVTVTIPASTFAVGNVINIQSIGVGLTTISGGAVTITSTGDVSSAPVLRALIVRVLLSVRRRTYLRLSGILSNANSRYYCIF